MRLQKPMLRNCERRPSVRHPCYHVCLYTVSGVVTLRDCRPRPDHRLQWQSLSSGETGAVGSQSELPMAGSFNQEELNTSLGVIRRLLVGALL